MKQHSIVEDNDDLLKIFASAWKSLSAKDRAYWDEEARNDKVRFVQEKAAYRGPWSVPKRRAKKHVRIMAVIFLVVMRYLILLDKSL